MIDACCASTPTWPGGSALTRPAVSRARRCIEEAHQPGRWSHRFRGDARSWTSSSASGCPRFLPFVQVVEARTWPLATFEVALAPLPQMRQMMMAIVLPCHTLQRLHLTIPLEQLRTLMALMALLAYSTLLLMPTWPLSKVLARLTTGEAPEGTCHRKVERGVRRSTILLASPLRKISTQHQLAPSSTGCATARNSVQNASNPALTC